MATTKTESRTWLHSTPDGVSVLTFDGHHYAQLIELGVEAVAEMTTQNRTLESIRLTRIRQLVQLAQLTCWHEGYLDGQRSNTDRAFVDACKAQMRSDDYRDGFIAGRRSLEDPIR